MLKLLMNYVLGTGDEIGISIYGFAEYNERFLVEQDGIFNHLK